MPGVPVPAGTSTRMGVVGAVGEMEVDDVDGGGEEEQDDEEAGEGFHGEILMPLWGLPLSGFYL